MSAITKPCDTCAGNGRPVTFWNGVVDCVDCSGTGRAPDVEATLRAENATLKESLERALVCLYGADATLDDARKVPTMVNVELDKRNAEIARLTAEVDRMTALYRYADDGHDENMRETARLIGEVERLTADNSYARDDISRLYDVVWRLTKHHGTACKTRQRMTAPRCASPCDQCDIDDAAMVAIGAGILHHGQKCDQFGREQASARASEIPHDCLVSSVTRGGAWLPANPLTVIEIAARIFGKRHGLTPSIELLGPDETDGWTCRIVVAGNVSVMAAGGRDEIGVLTLREVCRV